MNWKDNPKIMLPMGAASIAAFGLSTTQPSIWIMAPAASGLLLFFLWLLWRVAVSIHHGVEYFDYKPWPFELRILAKLRLRRLKRLGLTALDNASDRIR